MVTIIYIYVYINYITCTQDNFIATMQVLVTKKQKVMVKKQEGWYSADEMKADLAWSA